MLNLTEIADFEAPELDVYARLTEAQLLNRFEPAKGMFIAESPKVIMRALDAGCVGVSFGLRYVPGANKDEFFRAAACCTGTLPASSSLR